MAKGRAAGTCLSSAIFQGFFNFENTGLRPGINLTAHKSLVEGFDMTHDRAGQSAGGGAGDISLPILTYGRTERVEIGGIGAQPLQIDKSLSDRPRADRRETQPFVIV